MCIAFLCRRTSRIACVLCLALMPRAVLAQETRPTTPSSASPFYLLERQQDTWTGLMPPLRRELFRQAMLVAARDGLGLPTRDESLREWSRAAPASAWVFDVEQDGNKFVSDKGATVWQQRWTVIERPDQSIQEVAQAEGLSRKEYVELLKADGLSGNANATNRGAPASEEVKRWVESF